jgi:hypothetical protein
MRSVELKPYRILFLLAAFSLSSCEDFGDPPPRFIPGVSVDGVRLGDSKEVVAAVLGRPDGVGWVDGAWRSWLAYSYHRPKRYSLVIEFIDNLDEYGPVDKINVTNGYDGTTREGIGIGSLKAFVQRHWGPPRKKIPTIDGEYAVYCFGSKFVTLRFDNDTVGHMSTGFFIPCPADTFQTCN